MKFKVQKFKKDIDYKGPNIEREKNTDYDENGNLKRANISQISQEILNPSAGRELSSLINVNMLNKYGNNKSQKITEIDLSNLIKPTTKNKFAYEQKLEQQKNEQQTIEEANKKTFFKNPEKGNIALDVGATVADAGLNVGEGFTSPIENFADILTNIEATRRDIEAKNGRLPSYMYRLNEKGEVDTGAETLREFAANNNIWDLVRYWKSSR